MSVQSEAPTASADPNSSPVFLGQTKKAATTPSRNLMDNVPTTASSQSPVSEGRCPLGTMGTADTQDLVLEHNNKPGDPDEVVMGEDTLKLIDSGLGTAPNDGKEQPAGAGTFMLTCDSNMFTLALDAPPLRPENSPQPRKFAAKPKPQEREKRLQATDDLFKKLLQESRQFIRSVSPQFAGARPAQKPETRSPPRPKPRVQSELATPNPKAALLLDLDRALSVQRSSQKRFVEYSTTKRNEEPSGIAKEISEASFSDKDGNHIGLNSFAVDPDPNISLGKPNDNSATMQTDELFKQYLAEQEQRLSQPVGISVSPLLSLSGRSMLRYIPATHVLNALGPNCTQPETKIDFIAAVGETIEKAFHGYPLTDGLILVLGEVYNVWSAETPTAQDLAGGLAMLCSGTYTERVAAAFAYIGRTEDESPSLTRSQLCVYLCSALRLLVKLLPNSAKAARISTEELARQTAAQCFEEVACWCPDSRKITSEAFCAWSYGRSHVGAKSSVLQKLYATLLNSSTSEQQKPKPKSRIGTKPQTRSVFNCRTGPGVQHVCATESSPRSPGPFRELSLNGRKLMQTVARKPHGTGKEGVCESAQKRPEKLDPEICASERGSLGARNVFCYF